LRQDVDNVPMIASACLFLASKVVERPVSLNNIVKAYSIIDRQVKTAKNPKLIIPPLSPSAIEKLRTQFKAIEFEILCAINFELTVDLPYRVIDEYKNELTEWSTHNVEAFMRAANNFANDSFLT